ncbi:MAG: alpha/beta fold hydrolase [Gammaproteobacteria bacterium]|nr:alpha/beta fold hydrolase [Gammaproteobacteria bacterium]
MRSDISFPGHGGVTLRGWLYTPAGSSNGPALIMAHGFSATIDMGLDAFARVFCDAGITVLAYDQRNFGVSDGEPRQEINIWAQARDYFRAIDWLSARPEVDAQRVGIWGSSFSGGEVMVVAACDRRVAAVIADVPFASLPDTEDRLATPGVFETIRAALLDESGGGPADAGGDPIGPLAVVAQEGLDLPVFLSFPEATQWFLEHGARASRTWQNRVTLRNLPSGPPPFDPGVCASHIAPVPLLMVVASEDQLAPTDGALLSFERAGEPKRLELIEGDHFVPYDGLGFVRSSTAMRDFLVEYL